MILNAPWEKTYCLQDFPGEGLSGLSPGLVGRWKGWGGALELDAEFLRCSDYPQKLVVPQGTQRPQDTPEKVEGTSGQGEQGALGLEQW